MGLSMSDFNSDGKFEKDRARERILKDPFKKEERKLEELKEMGIPLEEKTEEPKEQTPTPDDADDFQKSVDKASAPGTCAAKTKAGSRCKRVAGFGEKDLYCKQHAK